MPAASVKGEEQLNALFKERFNYIQNQGGPFFESRAIKIQTELLFWQVDHPYCPHCPPEPARTADQEIGYVQTIKAKAEGGDTLSQYILATRYLEGRGISQNTSQGIFWIEKAALNGNIDAAYSLALMYDQGLHVDIDKQKAVKFYLLSAKKFNVAAHRLGEMYEYGLGVSEDYAKALEWYVASGNFNNPAWEKRYTRAAFSIGRLYAQGKGVPKNYAVAAEWFLMASDFGEGYGGRVGEAQCALAIMYSTGLGVKPDNEQVEFWLHRPNTKSYCNVLITTKS